MTLGELPQVQEVHPPEDPPAKPYTIGETMGRMARAVVTGDEYTNDPENDINLTQAQRGYSVADAFDRGARLALPDVPVEPLDDSYTRARRNIESQMGPDGRPKRNRSRASGVAGADELTKLFATGLITLITFTVGDWALPTAEEATELSRPLANIMARRIDIAAKLGKDGNDVIAFSIAVMAYMVRVGPLATERVRDAWAERQHRTHIDGVLPGGLDDSYGESSMDAGQFAGTGASSGPAYDPFDALAKTRDVNLRGLDRSLGRDQGHGDPVGAVGQ